MIETLTSVTIEVENQDEALEFYTEKLGFEKAADYPMGPDTRWVTVAPPSQEGLELVLQPPVWFEGEEASRRAAMIGEQPELVFGVDDCRATYEELSERGVTFTTEPEELDYGVQAVASDLYGNPIVLLEESDD